MTFDLSTIRAVMFDMDGVLYRGTLPLGGVNEILAFLEQQAIPYACITNNAMRTPAQFAETVQAFGFAIPAERIVTSAMATNMYLRSIASRGTHVYAIGMEGLMEPLFGDGYFVPDEKTPAYVVVGADFELAYAKLRTACLAIRAGATFIGTNPDKTFPAEDGIVPGCGAILAALEAATGQTPTVIGKPQAAMFEAALAVLGTGPATTLIVGDRYDTDIVGGAAVGLKTALVLTGVSSAEDVHHGSVAPDLVVADLLALLDLWRATIATASTQ